MYFFNDTATTEIYTLSLHDALPISGRRRPASPPLGRPRRAGRGPARPRAAATAAGRRDRWRGRRSEEHTSELQLRQYLVCCLLLEKKKFTHISPILSSSSYSHHLML